MNALGLVRQGNIEEAVQALLKEWTSLPGGRHARKGRLGEKNGVYSISDLMAVYKRNLLEI